MGFGKVCGRVQIPGKNVYTWWIPGYRLVQMCCIHHPPLLVCLTPAPPRMGRITSENSAWNRDSPVICGQQVEDLVKSPITDYRSLSCCGGANMFHRILLHPRACVTLEFPVGASKLALLLRIYHKQSIDWCAIASQGPQSGSQTLGNSKKQSSKCFLVLCPCLFVKTLGNTRTCQLLLNKPTHVSVQETKACSGSSPEFCLFNSPTVIHHVWANCNNSLTRNRVIFEMIHLIAHDSRFRSQWGRYKLPRPY